MEAALSYNPSFTWCSISSSQEFLKVDFRRIIIDRSSINIWTRSWLIFSTMHPHSFLSMLNLVNKKSKICCCPVKENGTLSYCNQL